MHLALCSISSFSGAFPKLSTSSSIHYIQLVNIIIQMVLLQPFRNQQKILKQISYRRWLAVLVMFLVAWLTFFFISDLYINSRPMILLQLDTIIVFFQFIMYMKNHRDNIDRHGDSIFQMKIFALLTGQNNISDNTGKKTDTEKYVDEPLVF